MKKFQLAKVTSPSIEFECMGTVIPSKTIENTSKTPNFAEPVLERKILVSYGWLKKNHLLAFRVNAFTPKSRVRKYS